MTGLEISNFLQFRKGWILYQHFYHRLCIKKRIYLASSLSLYLCLTQVNTLVILVSKLSIFLNLLFAIYCWRCEPTEENPLGKESKELSSCIHLPPLS